MVTFAHPWYFIISLGFVCFVSIWHWYYYKRPTLIYSSLNLLGTSGTSELPVGAKFLELLTFLGLVSFCIALGQPRMPDPKSKLPVEGIDIMLALDVSGSMGQVEDPKQNRSRFAIAKQAALSFISKRLYDAIGLVFFGKLAIARTPLTLDKQLLKEILEDTQIGIVNPDGTVIARALLTSINKLKNSQAKTKVIILLSDGMPTNPDIDPAIALKLAQDLGIRIYTIGIGEYTVVPAIPGMASPLANFFGVGDQIVPIDWTLLKELAQKTGGQFFLAKDAADLDEIYESINQLEKTKLDAPIFGKYFEYFPVFVWLGFLLLIVKLLLAGFIWVIL